MDLLFFGKTLIRLLPVLLNAFRILLLSIFWGSILGAIVAKGKMGKNKVISGICNGYITVIRCTPSIVLLYVIYYGLPMLFGLFGFDINVIEKETYIIIAFSLFCGASLSEVFRSAYQSVDIGQREAGISIGLTGFQTFHRIIFPQMIPVILPPFGNSVIAVLNESSLGFAIGYMDILGTAKLVGGQYYGAKNAEIYCAAGILYWGSSILIGRIIRLLESYTAKKKGLCRL